MVNFKLKIFNNSIKHNINNVFMAFSGRSSESSGIQRLVGVGAVKILAVNPTRAEWNKIIGNDNNTNPIEYNTTKVVDGKNVEIARVTFITQVCDTTNPRITTIVPITFFVENRVHISQSNNLEVIDRFGRTAYIDNATFKAKGPVYWGDSKRFKVETSSYRPALVGEANLTAFIKAFLNIPDVEVYNSELGTFVEETNEEALALREASFSNPKNFFKGDFTEVINAIKSNPDNKVKILFGVRHSEGKDYQDFYNAAFLKNPQYSLKNITKSVTDAKSVGRYPNTDFEFCTIKLWEPKPSTFDGAVTPTTPSWDLGGSTTEVDDLPFADEEDAKGDNPWGL